MAWSRPIKKNFKEEYQVLFPSQTFHEISAMLVFTKWACVRLGQREACVRICQSSNKKREAYPELTVLAHCSFKPRRNCLLEKNLAPLFQNSAFSPFLLSYKASFSLPVILPETTSPEIRHIFVIRAQKAPAGKVFALLPVSAVGLLFSIRRVLRTSASKASLSLGVNNFTFP